MLGGKGYYRAAASWSPARPARARAASPPPLPTASAARGGRCLYSSSEESPEQIVRNMRSIGIDLGRRVRKGLLRFHAVRPTLYGLERHLVTMHKLVTEFQPEAVVMDPITNLAAVGDDAEIKAMLTRLIDFLKSQGITALFTSLTAGGSALEQTEVGVSSLMDTWLLLRMVESASERNRVLYVLKSRGMAPLQPDARVPADRQGHRAGGRLYRPRRGLYRRGAAEPGGAGPGRGAGCSSRPPSGGSASWSRSSRSLQAQVAALQAKLANIEAETSASPPAWSSSAPTTARRIRGAHWRARAKSRLKNRQHADEAKHQTKHTAPTRWELRLYVAGQTPKSVAAFANLKKICEEHLAGRYQIEVIDLLEEPAAGRGRPDPGHPDAGAQAARAGQEDHRRPVQRRARAGRPGPAAGVSADLL